MQEDLIQKNESALWEALYRTADSPAVATVVANNLLDTEVVGQHRGLFLAALVTLRKANERRRRVQLFADVVLAVPRGVLRWLKVRRPESQGAERPQDALLEELLFALQANKELAGQIAQILSSAVQEADSGTGAMAEHAAQTSGSSSAGVLG